jgi:hypothetical protein
MELRAAPRSSVRIFANEYIDRVPCLCEVLELSQTGMLVRRLLGPESELATYAIELGREDGVGADRMWLCAASVWKSDALEALAFVGHSDTDRKRLGDLLASL